MVEIKSIQNTLLKPEVNQEGEAPVHILPRDLSQSLQESVAVAWNLL